MIETNVAERLRQGRPRTLSEHRRPPLPHEEEPANNQVQQQEAEQLRSVVVGLAAIRYLLDTAIEAVQQRRQADDNNNE